MEGVEEHDEGRHDDDDNMIMMMTLPLLSPLPLANDLKNKTINSIGRMQWAIKG